MSGQTEVLMRYNPAPRKIDPASLNVQTTSTLDSPSRFYRGEYYGWCPRAELGRMGASKAACAVGLGLSRQ